MSGRAGTVAALSFGVAALVAVGAGTGAVAATQITGAQIKDGTVTSADIKNETLRSGDVLNGSLTGSDIKNGTVGKADLAAGAVSDLVPRVARPGQTQVGTYGAWGGGTSFVGDSVTFRSTLPVDIPDGRITFVRNNAFTTECPAVGSVVPHAWACVYEGGFSATVLSQVYRPDLQGVGVRTFGFGLLFNCSAASCWSFGTYAVKAGTAADIALAPSKIRRATPG